jgi:hypothetical protein
MNNIPIISTLNNTIKSIWKDAVNDFNTVRLPALETAWGRPYAEEFGPKEGKQEVTKAYSRIIGNTFYRHIHAVLPDFAEDATTGRDYVFMGLGIEAKITLGDDTSNSWTGNGFEKTPVHLLMKFNIDATGQIVGVYIAIVDLSLCSATWTEKQLTSNFSTLKFRNGDIENIHTAVGGIRKAKTYLYPTLEAVRTQETRD